MEFDINNLISDDKNLIDDKKYTKAKPGRPKVAKPKNKKTMVYFTEDEHRELTKKAALNNMSLSNYLRITAIKENIK